MSGVNLYRKLKTDDKKVEDGVWFENVLGPASFKLARTTSKKFQDKMKKLAKPYRHALRKGGDLEDEKLIELYAEAASRHILLDWKNIVDDDGEDIPYSPEVGKQYLIALDDLRGIISELSGDLEAFREEYIEESEESLKNT